MLTNIKLHLNWLSITGLMNRGITLFLLEFYEFYVFHPEVSVKQYRD